MSARCPVCLKADTAGHALICRPYCGVGQLRLQARHHFTVSVSPVCCTYAAYASHASWVSARSNGCHACDCLPRELGDRVRVMRLVDCDCDTRVTCHKDGSTRSGGWRALARNALTRHTLHENLCKKHSHSFRGADPTDRHKLVDRFRPLEIPTSGLHPLRLPRVSAMA